MSKIETESEGEKEKEREILILSNLQPKTSVWYSTENVVIFFSSFVHIYFYFLVKMFQPGDIKMKFVVCIEIEIGKHINKYYISFSSSSFFPSII